MKKLVQEPVRQQLMAAVRAQIAQVTKLQGADPDLLLRQATPGAWSAVQILDHLNSYGSFYLPEIDKAIRRAKSATGLYKPGWLGNYFVQVMQLDEKSKPKKKMKAVKRHQPDFHADPGPVLRVFLQQQQLFLQYLERAQDIDWGSSRTRVSLAGWMRMKLGDCLRFMVAHQQRHGAQLERTINVFNVE